MNVDRKKYLLIMPPFLIIAVLLFLFLPTDKKGFSTFAIVGAWVIYFLWKYLENKKKDE
ncbi:hypothetical protein [Bacillus sp. CGMCC 1.16541]|uniref:hypothetical protein n=1 Tax=Bacillus sp. CGMCC 1.16541 TaxID=2185143 RepID=UPI0013A5456F|nr:hypothetical protein [Bacillus sp. CGMCC 1.16541]